MQNLIISKLDYQRLKDRIVQAQSDPSVSRNQLMNLARGVDSATLLEPTEIPADVVTMNSQVRISYLESHKTLELRLVYPEQVNISQNQISIFAPLATALLGCKQNDIVTLPISSRTVKIKIDQIVYQPEAAGDYTL